jgi:hypothetical protein
LSITLTQADQPVSAARGPNLIRNGTFNGLESWTQAKSDAPGQFKMWTADNGVLWERTGSRNDGANFGVLQPLDVDVSGSEKLILELDARVDWHTLRGTGWWSEERGGPGETPVHIGVSYVDDHGKGQSWHYGFLIHEKGGALAWRNPQTGEIEKKSAKTTRKNYTVILPGKWHHASFDLLDEEVRRDPRGAEALPRPARVTRIYVYGSGWDFRGSVANLSLRSE